MNNENIYETRYWEYNDYENLAASLWVLYLNRLIHGAPSEDKQNDLEEENLNEETMAAANFKPRKMEEGFRNVHNNWDAKYPKNYSSQKTRKKS